ncbi:protein suppressor of variegation 3-7 [Drosophila obscura]|uniref:protein suppressor of variegation 3-7 n=1 Tax=Drosophila obscura TaxID=7282 RepID=UPI001BB0FDEB|nr:protein suppressor of variegation 3-7 [Drosophila obscura]
MSFSENNSDSDWKEARVRVARKIKQGARQDNDKKLGGKPKYNQRFCEKWLNIFEPWLRRSDDDPNKPFCRACHCRLDCNRCHLVRHERTTKHKRNLEALITKGEGAIRNELTVRQERSKYFQKRPKPASPEKSNVNEPEYLEAVAPEPIATTTVHVITTEVDDFPTGTRNIDETNYSISSSTVPKQEILSETETNNKPNVESHSGILQETDALGTDSPTTTKRNTGSSSSNQEGLRLLMQIHQDKNELMESFRELMGSNQSTHPPPPKEKNHVDLFFESVSSSVKALSPKLIAEAKMRVSQIICELELRGLKDNSTNEDVIEMPMATPPAASLYLLRQSSSGCAVVQQPHFGGLS